VCEREGDSLSTNSCVCAWGRERVHDCALEFVCERERSGEFLNESVWVRVECVAVCCGALRCVAVCCGVLQCVAVFL